jgi:hypothetical protein
MVFGSENMRSAEIFFSKRSGEEPSGCLFEERSDELYPVGADRLFSRKPYPATSFSEVYAAESGNTFLEVYPERSRRTMKKKSTAACSYVAFMNILL